MQDLLERESSADRCRRATYLLERGVWRATCNACGQQFADPDRRRLNRVFRTHVQERRDMIDLTDNASLEVAPHSASPMLSAT